jgi:hypothetical protein
MIYLGLVSMYEMSLHQFALANIEADPGQLSSTALKEPPTSKGMPTSNWKYSGFTGYHFGLADFSLRHDVSIVVSSKAG